MAKLQLKTMTGELTSVIELNDSVYGLVPNVPVVHQVVVAENASYRQGTHSVKNRHDVSGGGKKPFRQKGTGRARQGSIRAAQWTGGGVVFGPTPRTHAKRINNKMVKLALKSVLSGKLQDNELVIVENFGFEAPSTKAAVNALKAWNVSDRRVTVVVADDDINSYLSFRNVPNVTVIAACEATTRFLTDNKALVMSDKVANQFGEVLA